jgi:hypothetical protein
MAGVYEAPPGNRCGIPQRVSCDVPDLNVILGGCRLLQGRDSGWQGRVHPPARAYLERKQTEGKSRREAIRCLKRQLTRTVYVTLRNEPPLT